MTEQEYHEALQHIVLDGLGFDAIQDLSVMLANYDANILASLREARAERKAIRKICESDTPAKRKVETVLTML